MTTFRTANGRLGTRNGKLLRIGAGGTGCCPECDQPVPVCPILQCPECPAQYTLSVSGAQLHTPVITVGGGPLEGTWKFEIPTGMTIAMNCIVIPNPRGTDLHRYVNGGSDPFPSFTGGVSQPDNNFAGRASLSCGLTPDGAFWGCSAIIITKYFPTPEFIGLTLNATKAVLPGETCPSVGSYTVISSSTFFGSNNASIQPDLRTLIVPEFMVIS